MTFAQRITLKQKPITRRAFARLSIALTALVLSLFATVSMAEVAAPKAPDLTAGGKPDSKHRWTLGTTGARGWVWSRYVAGGSENSDARQILITEVAKGSSADGVLENGDVVTGLNGRPFDGDARRLFAQAVMEAEKETNGGADPNPAPMMSIKEFTGRKSQAELPREAADPDAGDMSVWKYIKPGLHSGFGSVDVAYSRSIPPAADISESIKLDGWKGERVHCQMLVWSSGREDDIRITASGFSGDQFQVTQENVSISMVNYVLTDAFPGGIDRRDKARFPIHLKPDRLSGTNCFNLDAPGTRPVWISVDIPAQTPAGIYQGTISRQSASGAVNHRISLEVLNATLPAPSAWAFHLDLWQHPDAVARYGRVAMWSPEHLNLLRPMLTLLAQAGQKCITTTLIEEPWNHQTYDDFGGMIKWTRRADGTWTYDYSHFDSYVAMAMQCGINQQINCYSMVPVGNRTSWFDEKSAKSVTVELLPGTAEYETVWRSFLTDFTAHLKEKGWLERTAIALDERDEAEMKKLFGFLKATAPELKISMAGFYSKELTPSIYDFSSNWRAVDQVSGEVMASRRKSGLKSTFYVACMIPKPNTFTFSPPAESCYLGWFASALGFDGFLRWAYNSWVENPEVDSRFTKWPGGDAYLVYPNAQRSIRFERLREGIQDYEKIRILREELVRNPSAEAVSARTRLNTLMSSIHTQTLGKRSAADVVNEGKQVLYEIVKSVPKSNLPQHRQRQ